MSEWLQGHRTKLNANKMTWDGRCSSRRKQPVISSFSRTVQSSGVAWTWAATLMPWRILADCSTLVPRPWQWAAAAIWCHCHSLSLASVKSRLVLPFWYRLTRVVPEKGPLIGCVCVCHQPPSLYLACVECDPSQWVLSNQIFKRQF